MVKALVMITEMSPTGVPNLVLAQLKAINEYNKTVQEDQKIRIDIVNNDHSRTELENAAKELGAKVFHIAKASNFAAFTKEFTKLLKDGEYDVFHSQFEAPSFYPLFLAKKAGVKIRIATAHNLYDIHGFSPTSIYIRLTRRFIPQVATHLMAVSQICGISQFGKVFKKRGIFFPVIAPWAKKFNSQKRIVKRKEWKIENDEIAILQVGLLTDRKDPVFSIQVLKRIVEKGIKAKLIFVGDGPKRCDIRKMAQDLGLENNVLILGALTDLEGVFDGADFLFMPSVFEGFGMAAIEGSANGLISLVSTGVVEEAVYTPAIVRLEKDAEKWAESVIKSVGNLPDRGSAWSDFLGCDFAAENAIRTLIDVYTAR